MKVELYSSIYFIACTKNKITILLIQEKQKTLIYNIYMLKIK